MRPEKAPGNWQFLLSVNEEEGREVRPALV
jgi:hypothetical protein